MARVFAELEAQPENKFCMAMLDYNARTLVAPGTRTRRRFTEQDVLIALAPRTARGVYRRQDTAMRDAFDGFFNAFDRLGQMCAANLVEWDDLEPYAAYWLKLLESGPRQRSAEFGAIVRRYVFVFHFEGLASLMAHADVPTHYSSEDDRLVKAFARRLSRTAASARGAPAKRAKTPPSGSAPRPRSSRKAPLTVEEPDLAFSPVTEF